MKKYLRVIIIVLVILLCCKVVQNGIGMRLIIKWARAQQSENSAESNASNDDIYEKLVPLHEEKRAAKNGDWLDRHYEPGQTFEQFVEEYPDKLPEGLTTIYVTLVGEFDEKQKEIIDQTIEYIQIFYGYPVKVQSQLAVSEIPEHARRRNPFTRQEQILTRHVIEQVLIPQKKPDAVASIALASSDLWPGMGWNFVFGEASPDDRVGIWSIYRNGDPSKGEKAYRLTLRRTIKTAIHEIGHMFGLAHCTYYECLINGSNHRAESDSQPLYFCPVCLKKIHWMLEQDPKTRFKAMADVTKKFELIKEQSFYEKSLNAL